MMTELQGKASSAFAGYHPAVSLAYFAAVLLFSMIIMHPAALLISLAGAFAWSVRLGGKRAVRANLLYMIPTLVITALLNPAFNHAGGTILAYLPTGNPLTLESIVYGVAAAIMLVTVICWFTCWNRVITTDKLVYLFGRVIPALSLVLSMSLRFVPRFGRQIKVVADAQKCIGRDASTGPVLQRAKNGIRILSIMITWSLENAIETADSMKSRGYGLKGRTSFSLYRFDGRDKTMLSAILALAGFILSMAMAGGLYCRYFPTFRLAPWDAWSVSALLAYGLLCALPLTVDMADGQKWRRLERGSAHE